MSVNITKQGIVYACGSDIQPNLLKGTNIQCILNTDGSKSMTYTCPDLSKLKAGVVLTVSVDIEVYNVNTMRRIGCEPSFTSSGSSMYIGVWTSDKTNRRMRIFNTVTLARDAIALSQNGIYIQDITFNSGGYIILSNPKLEINSTPTAWCPNINDDYYVGGAGGFIERSASPSIYADAQIYEDHVECIEFIEW